MKVAIHNEGDSFTSRWVEYCQQNNVSFKMVDCYDDTILESLSDCDALIWHHSHMRPKDILIAKQLLFSLEHSGTIVFPNFKTNWHFDDKLGQKYLFEALQLPHVRTYAFYSKKEASSWAGKTVYPKVFKLRGGSGSSNVRLVKDKSQALKLIAKAFGSGFSNYQAYSNLKERFRKYQLGKASLFSVFKGVARLMYPTQASNVKGRERGYAYFQEFIPGNDSDIRVVIIGERAFAIKRIVRKNDFRASGGGNLRYAPQDIPLSALKLAFEANDKIGAQCIAFDIVYKNDIPLIIEISYGFKASGYDACPGYWDRDLRWTEGKFNPYGWMVDLVVNAARGKSHV